MAPAPLDDPQALQAMAAELSREGIRDPRVLDAMARVPRAHFVPEASRGLAHAPVALPLSHGQTISQPFVVARMLELAELSPGDRVLDVGAGSGYQTAVLEAMDARVDGLELLPELAEAANARLAELGAKARVHAGDGHRGLPSRAPFDAILVAAAADAIPPTLRAQLADGGRLVMPVGPPSSAAGPPQRLVRLRRDGDEWSEASFEPVVFVPFV